MKKQILVSYLFLMGKTLCAQQQMVVSVALADIRHELVPAPEGVQGPAMSGDIGKQETQVYFGEPILAEAIDTKPGWMKVYIMDQSTWDDNFTNSSFRLNIGINISINCN